MSCTNTCNQLVVNTDFEVRYLGKLAQWYVDKEIRNYELLTNCRLTAARKIIAHVHAQRMHKTLNMLKDWGELRARFICSPPADNG